MTSVEPCDSKHLVGAVSTTPSAACFTAYLDLPVPWDLVASGSTLQCLRRLGWVCPGALELTSVSGEYLYGRESLSIHCHCDSPDSLQCRARGVVVQTLATSVIQGCFFNRRFIWYAEEVCVDLPKAISCRGSYMVAGLHFVVFCCRQGDDFWLLKQQLSGPSVKFLCTATNYYFIRLCTGCMSLHERDVRQCAVQSRELLQEAFRLLRVGGPRPRVFYPAFRDGARRRRLRRLMVYGTPVPWRKFTSGV